MRFSADKRPYKDHLGLVTANDSTTSYYLQVSHHGLMLAGGLYEPAREQLARSREIIDDNRLVGDLEATLDEVGESGFAIMTTDALATAPRGFSVNHPKIALIRLKRLAISAEHAPMRWMHGPELIDRVRAGWRTVRVVVSTITRPRLWRWAASAHPASPRIAVAPAVEVLTAG